MTKKKASSIAARIRKVKLTPADKLDRAIDTVQDAQEVEEELQEKLCTYAVDLQHGMDVYFRNVIKGIQDRQRRQIPEDRQYELAETDLSLLIAKVCLAERMLASR